MKRALLLLADGSLFQGELVGKPGTTTGEIVFNTGMTGYQETITDASYAGQIITFTFPLIGICGVNDEDDQGRRTFARGLVVSEYTPHMDNFHADRLLGDKLKTDGITGISGVDTRYLTKLIRDAGEMKAIITSELTEAEAKRALAEAPELTEEDVVSEVITEEPYDWPPPGREVPPLDGFEPERFRVAVMDFGVKYGILDCLTERGCQVRAFPGTAGVEAIEGYQPDGVVISNGPGDPSRLSFAFETVRQLAERYPTFGICKGHQLIALALGLSTYKMKFGHRGENHPVRDLADGRAHITSQNHSFAVGLPDETVEMLRGQGGEPLPGGHGLPLAKEEFALPGSELVVDKVHINDGTVEGLHHQRLPCFSVQYHPEGHPGPEDNLYLFDRFVGMLG